MQKGSHGTEGQRGNHFINYQQGASCDTAFNAGKIQLLGWYLDMIINV